MDELLNIETGITVNPKQGDKGDASKMCLNITIMVGHSPLEG